MFEKEPNGLSESIDVEVQAKQWEKRQQEKDARNFENYVNKMRENCGLGVLYV